MTAKDDLWGPDQEGSTTVKARALVPAKAALPSTLTEVGEWTREMDTFYRSLMQEGTDYGRIPGTPKPTLFKAGAELLAFRLHLDPHEELVSEELDRGERWYKAVVRFTLYDFVTGERRGDGLGTCHSWESKYRYRKDADGNRILNEDWADQINTILKMAGKRAFVDAILRRTGASRIFTQDLEDIEQPPHSVERKGHYCAEHKTVFFKKGRMKHWGHPIEGSAPPGGEPKWCHEPLAEEDIEEKEASSVAPEDGRIGPPILGTPPTKGKPQAMTQKEFALKAKELGYAPFVEVFAKLGINSFPELEEIGYAAALALLPMKGKQEQERG